MGHPLFERVGKQLVLTEAGRIALDYADTVFKAGDELMSTLERAAAGEPAGPAGRRADDPVAQLPAGIPAPAGRPRRRGADRSLGQRSATCSRSSKPTPSTSFSPIAPPSATPASPFRNHLLDEQPVSLVGRPRAGKRRSASRRIFATSRSCCRASTATSASASTALLDLAESGPSSWPRSTTWPCCGCSPASARA